MNIKSILLVFVIGLIAITSMAQKTIASYTISQFAGEEYHTDLSVDVQYDSKQDKVYLNVDARKVGKFIILKSEDRTELVTLLNKVLDWKAKADTIHAVFEKEVGTIRVGGGFMYGDKFRFDFSNVVSLNFEGSIEDDGGYKTLIWMTIPKMVASDNEYMDCDSHLIFFDEVGINELISGLTTAIVEFNKKESQKGNVGSQFN